MNRQRWLFAALIGIFFLPLYFLTTNQVFTFDALTSALACETNAPGAWFHPNHPLHPFLGMVWFRAAQWLGYDGPAIYSLAKGNSVFTVMGLIIFFLALSRLVSPRRALITTFFLGTTYTVWFHAVEGVDLGLILFFSSLVIRSLFALSERAATRGRDTLILGGASALAVLCHGIAIFHVLPVGWWLYRSALKKTNGGDPMRGKALPPTVLYFLTILTICGVVYAGLFFIVRPAQGFSGFISWSLGYAGFYGVDNVLKSPFWAFDILHIGQGLWDGWILAFYHPPASAGRLESFGLHLIGAGALAVLGLSIFYARKLALRERALFITLILWGLMAMTFLAFWSPGQLGFRLHVLIPWAAACAVAFGRSRTFFAGQALAGLLIFSMNFTGPIYHDAFIENNAGFQLLKQVDSHLNPHDYFISSRGEIPVQEALRPYFFPHLNGGTVEGRMLEFRERGLSSLAENIRTRSKVGRGIYFSEGLFNANIQTGIEKEFGLPEGDVQKFISQFQYRKAFELSNGLQVFLVVPR